MLSVHVLFPTIIFDLLITGVDSTMLELSLSSAWRYRRADAEQVASAEITSFMEAVKQSGTRIVVQFDEKEIEHDIGGKVIDYKERFGYN